MQKIKIGVFDSGIGGLSVADAIKKELPDLEVVYKNDAQHVPYGNRDIKEIHEFVRPIFQSFIDEDCKVIVVACNTVTTNLIKELRQEFTVPLVGMEPAIKPAAEATKSKIIAVCATPRTLESIRYKWLKDHYAPGIKVLGPDCSEWGSMIEHHTVNREKIAEIVNRICADGADQIVLGCTHYVWIEDLIKEISAGRASVIQPEAPVIAQLKVVLASLK